MCSINNNIYKNPTLKYFVRKEFQTNIMNYRIDFFVFSFLGVLTLGRFERFAFRKLVGKGTFPGEVYCKKVKQKNIKFSNSVVVPAATSKGNTTSQNTHLSVTLPRCTHEVTANLVFCSWATLFSCKCRLANLIFNWSYVYDLCIYDFETIWRPIWQPLIDFLI